MAEFLLELDVPRTDGVAVEHGAERSRIAAEELTREGTPVSYLRSIFVPEDETCFFLYEAVAPSDGRRGDAERKPARPLQGRSGDVAQLRRRSPGI